MKLSVTALMIMFLLSPLPTMAADNDLETEYSSSGQDMWKADASITYESGDFNTDKTTNTVYIPVTLTRVFPKGDVGWTIPYIHQESSPAVTAVAGRSFRTSPSPAGSKRSDSGLGDMLLKGRYYLVTEDISQFNLSPFIQIKFPTADDDKGLGTGEFDGTIGLESSKDFDNNWLGYLDLGYTFIGDPPGRDLDNQFSFAIGPGYKVSSDTTLSLLYEERTALVDGTSNPRDLVFNVDHKVQEHINVTGQMSAGLSEGSPAVGITAGLRSRF